MTQRRWSLLLMSHRGLYWVDYVVPVGLQVVSSLLQLQTALPRTLRVAALLYWGWDVLGWVPTSGFAGRSKGSGHVVCKRMREPVSPRPHPRNVSSLQKYMPESHFYVFSPELFVALFHVSIGFFVLWSLIVQSSLYVLCISPLSVVCAVNIFSWGISCLLILLIVFLTFNKIFFL